MTTTNLLTRRTWLSAALVLALIVLGLLWFRDRGTAGRTDEMRFQTAEARPGVIAERVDGVATISSQRSYKARPTTTGVVQMRAELGSEVAAGELLIRLDPRDQQRSLDQAELAIERARNRLRQLELSQASWEQDYRSNLSSLELELEDARINEARAEAAYQNAHVLYEADAITRQQLEDEALALDSAQRARRNAETRRNEAVASRSLQLQQYQADRNAAQLDLSEAEQQRQDALEAMAELDILAPFDGVVTEVLVSSGERVQSSQDLLVFEDLGQVQISLEVDEVDVRRVQGGMPLVLRSEALPGQSFETTVSRITPTARVVSDIAIFDVQGVIDNAGLELRPGMGAEASVILRQDEGLIIPVNALSVAQELTAQRGSGQPRQAAQAGPPAASSAEGERASVQVVTDTGELESREVTLGASDGLNVVVIDGLEPDMLVVTGIDASGNSTHPSANPSGGGLPFPRPRF